MRRFFAEKIDIADGKAVLSPDEARHIRNVLRMKTGDEVLLFDGSGTEYRSVITDFSGDSVTLDILGRGVSSADPEVHVTLFQCLPKQGKMELIIQKCVELGVYAVVPTVSKRCVVKLDGKEQKLQRYNRVSMEASKQCGRADIPEVKGPAELSSIDAKAFDVVLLAYENETVTTLKKALMDAGKIRSAAVVIGPEGGFEPAEAEMLISKGAVPVSLGRRILRTETAGMAALAQIMYELEQ
ncbi:MAG: 16S rRNA (uracil(1498)-N(3))-methyltransferase [Clostridia bacterium]|nr:16S rRNA (uracil(1498)-N(3))-methyltransferase [Clostridia bacterium]